MTVGELIAELQKLPQDKRIYGIWQERKIFFPEFAVSETEWYAVLNCYEEFDEH